MFANIGTTYVAWGNQLRDARLSVEARTRYRRAVEWLTRCREFSTAARLGKDTSEADVLLAEAYLGLDEHERASEFASAARDAAQKAGNELDLASSLAILGTVLHRTGRQDGAKAWEDAAHRFDGLGHPARAAKLRAALEKNALAFSRLVE